MNIDIEFHIYGNIVYGIWYSISMGINHLFFAKYLCIPRGMLVVITTNIASKYKVMCFRNKN